jgi:hypothetical protein
MIEYKIFETTMSLYVILLTTENIPFSLIEITFFNSVVLFFVDLVKQQWL